MENNETNNTPEQIPALRFRLKMLSGTMEPLGNIMLENINLGSMVFLRSQSDTLNDVRHVIDERRDLNKYNLDKQVVIFLSKAVEVLELEPIIEEHKES